MSLLSKQSLDTPNSQDSPRISGQSSQGLLSGKTCLLANNYSSTEWLIDSGTTDHICSNLSMFQTYKPVVEDHEYIVIPNRRHAPIHHIGSVKIHSNMILHNVLHIPHFQCNLIYVQRLCKDMACSVLFDGTNCIIQDPLQKGRQIFLGKSQGGLYSTSNLLQGKVNYNK